MSVYANGREVSGKAQPNRVIAGFPSVCLSPPSPPAGPIPIPYPMFTDASKTSDGTGSVQIKKKEVGKKNGSVYSSSKGNEPATRSFGMDVVSHTISGASKHQAYSFDVMFEKSGAERFMDLTTTNHGSDPATAATIDGAGASGAAGPPPGDCATLQAETNAMRQASYAGAAEQQRQQRHAVTQKQAKFLEKRAEKMMQGALTASSAGGGSGVSRYTSNELNREAVRQSGMPVEDQPQVTDTSSKVCGKGKPYKKKAHKYHTEAQMLEAAYSTTPVPASITFSTNWPAIDEDTQRIDPERKNAPCENCERKMAEACACGMKIYICRDGQASDYCKEIGAGQ